MLDKTFFAKNILLFLSMFCFLISLFQPCYGSGNIMPEHAQGLGLLIIGWMGILYGAPGLVWLANPLLLFSWIFNKKKIALIFGILAIVASVSFLFIKKMIADEAGNYSTLDKHYLGYWLWLTSMIINLANVFYQRYLLKTKNPNN